MSLFGLNALQSESSAAVVNPLISTQFTTHVNVLFFFFFIFCDSIHECYFRADQLFVLFSAEENYVVVYFLTSCETDASKCEQQKCHKP